MNFSKALGSLFKHVIFFLTIIGFYLQFSLGFPYSVFILAGILLALPALVARPLLFVPAALMSFVGLVSILGTLLGGIFDSGQIMSLGLLVLSLVSATGLAAAARRFGPQKVSIWFWRLSLLLIIGAALEVLGPLRPLSDAVRASIYPTGLLYEGEARDLSSAGFIRPMLFTSEPSHLGKMLAVFLIVSAANTNRRVKHMLAGAVGFAVVASPVILLAIVVPALLILRDRGIRRVFGSPPMLLLLALMSAGTVYFLFEAARTRLGLFGGALDPSAYLRIVRPIYMLREATLHRPLFGYGLGADDSLEQVTRAATAAGPYVGFVSQNLAKVGSQYGFSQIGILLSFGWLGGLGWLAATASLPRTFGGDRLAFWAFWIGYGFFQGAINTPLHLAPLFLLATARPFETCARAPTHRSRPLTGAMPQPLPRLGSAT